MMPLARVWAHLRRRALTALYFVSSASLQAPGRFSRRRGQSPSLSPGVTAGLLFRRAAAAIVAGATLDAFFFRATVKTFAGFGRLHGDGRLSVSRIIYRAAALPRL